MRSIKFFVSILSLLLLFTVFFSMDLFAEEPEASDNSIFLIADITQPISKAYGEIIYAHDIWLNGGVCKNRINPDNENQIYIWTRLDHPDENIPDIILTYHPDGDYFTPEAVYHVYRRQEDGSFALENREKYANERSIDQDVRIVRLY